MRQWFHRYVIRHATGVPCSSGRRHRAERSLLPLIARGRSARVSRLSSLHDAAPTTTYELVWDKRATRRRQSWARPTSSRPASALALVTSRAERAVPSRSSGSWDPPSGPYCDHPGARDPAAFAASATGRRRSAPTRRSIVNRPERRRDVQQAILAILTTLSW
jgi:hypothetical protein